MTEYILTILAALAVLFLAYGLSYRRELRKWLRHREWLSTPFDRRVF